MPPNLLTIQESARQAGCSIPTVYAAIQAGRLKTQTIGGHPYVIASSLGRWKPRAQGRPKGRKDSKPRKRVPARINPLHINADRLKDKAYGLMIGARKLEAAAEVLTAQVGGHGVEAPTDQIKTPAV